MWMKWEGVFLRVRYCNLLDRILFPRKLPKTRTITYGDRSFMHCGPTLWNVLPADIKNCDDFNQFKSLLKTHLFKKAYNCSEWLWYPLMSVQNACYYVIFLLWFSLWWYMILYFTFSSCFYPYVCTYILCAFIVLLFLSSCLYWYMCKVLASRWSRHYKEINYYYYYYYYYYY